MEEYFNGDKLYGDDFTFEQIQKWYDEEEEGYSSLGNDNKSNYTYGYHNLNLIHGFNHVKKDKLENVLGFGSAWGYEFEPIIDKISNLSIVEPSDKMQNHKIADVVPNYVKPEIDGRLVFEDNSFDLITAFGALHHVPNVSFVIKELTRVLKPGGQLIIREPIVTMGDWRKPRRGLTKNERGIPVEIFEKIFKDLDVEVESKGYSLIVTSLFIKIFRKFVKSPIYSYKWFVYFDKILSKIFKFNVHYHPRKAIDKVAPSIIFYVLTKK